MSDYWIGKDVLVEHGHRDLHGPNRMRGAGDLYVWESVGTFEDADVEGLGIRVHPLEHGRLPHLTGFPFTQLMHLKLLEGEGPVREVGQTGAPIH